MLTKAFVRAVRGRVEDGIQDHDVRQRLVKRLKTMERQVDNSARLLGEVISILQEGHDFTKDIRDEIAELITDQQHMDQKELARMHQIGLMLDLGMNDVLVPFTEDEWTKMFMLVSPEVFTSAFNALPVDKRAALMENVLI